MSYVWVALVLYIAVAEFRWFNKELFPQWWNCFKWNQDR